MDAKMLDGKVAIISGASYGMGQTMAELFAEEGAKVVMTARGKDKLDAAVKTITDKGYEAVGVVADNEKEEDVKKVFATAIETQMERGSEHNYEKREIALADSCIGLDACCIGMWEATSSIRNRICERAFRK